MSTLSLDALLKDIQSPDHAVRAAARDTAGPVGAKAMAPLAKLTSHEDIEVQRAALRAMQNIVYYAGRPQAAAEAKSVSAELLILLGEEGPPQLRRDVLWMTWQIAGEDAAQPVAALLSDPEVHEDARMALERLPGEAATAALKAALADASREQQPALAYSLRVRGVETVDVPDIRLLPTKQTSVQPVGR